MVLVELHLDCAAAIGLVDGLAHRVGDRVGIHHHGTVGVACRAADSLDERATVAQETLFVRIENRHERDLGQVEALAQQVDAHKHVNLALAQIAQNVHAVHRRGVGVHVVHLHTGIEQVVGEVLGHALGERRHQHALVPRGALANLFQQVVNLTAHGPHINLGVEEPRGTNDLLDVVLAHAQLVVTRRRRDVDELRDARLKLVKAQGTVVEGRRQAETVLHKRHLARAVSLVHTANLRNRHMALVDNAEHVLGEVVDEREGWLAGLTAVEMARVVLDTVAEAHGLEHLEVVVGALLQALRLKQLVGRFELRHALLALLLNRL